MSMRAHSATLRMWPLLHERGGTRGDPTAEVLERLSRRPAQRAARGGAGHLKRRRGARCGATGGVFG